MQVSLTEGLRLRLGDTSLFLTIACEPLNIVCGQNLMILALELSDSWSPGGVTGSCKDEGGCDSLLTEPLGHPINCGGRLLPSYDS